MVTAQIEDKAVLDSNELIVAVRRQIFLVNNRCNAPGIARYCFYYC